MRKRIVLIFATGLSSLAIILVLGVLAYALAVLLRKLSFDAWPVHCEHCDFPDETDTGHAWVRVSYRENIHDIDSTYMEHVTGKLMFTPRTPVKRYTPLFRLLAGWGSTAANARRYYQTESDKSNVYEALLQ